MKTNPHIFVLRSWARRLPLVLCAAIGIGQVSSALAQTLYSVTSGPGFPLVTIDPNTGAAHTIQSTGSFTGVTGTSTFDSSGRRLFFVVDAAGVPTLVVVNVQTGVVATHPIPLAGASYVFLEFDQFTAPPANVPAIGSFGKILALLALGLAGYFLARQPR